MGLWTNSQTLWLASRNQLWRLENTLHEGQVEDGYDRLFVPQVGYTTGDVDVHDMTVDVEGRLVFVCTLGSCLATSSERYSLEPLWHPPFVSRFATEDRCHLNGLAPEHGNVRHSAALRRDGPVELLNSKHGKVLVVKGDVFCNDIKLMRMSAVVLARM